MTTRLQQEQNILQKYFHGFRIQDIDVPERAGAVGRLRSNSGSNYSIWIPLDSFPYSRPPLYIVDPKKLRTHKGRSLAKLGVSCSMHTLAPSEHGHVQICHYNDMYWHPNLTLYKVVMKARLWIEAYESHLRTGAAIDQYLAHM